MIFIIHRNDVLVEALVVAVSRIVRIINLAIAAV